MSTDPVSEIRSEIALLTRKSRTLLSECLTHRDERRKVVEAMLRVRSLCVLTAMTLILALDRARDFGTSVKPALHDPIIVQCMQSVRRGSDRFEALASIQAGRRVRVVFYHFSPTAPLPTSPYDTAPVRAATDHPTKVRMTLVSERIVRRVVEVLRLAMRWPRAIQAVIRVSILRLQSPRTTERRWGALAAL